MTFEGFPVQRCQNRSARSESESSFTELWFVCLGRIANIPFLLSTAFLNQLIFRASFLRWDMVNSPEKRWDWISLRKGVVLLYAPTSSWILWKKMPSLWYDEVSQDELKNNELWLFEKKLPDDSRKTNTDNCFCKPKQWIYGCLVWIEWEAPKFDMSTTCMSDVRFFGFRRVLTHGNQPFWHMAGLKNSSWKWPRKYSRCFVSQTFITLAVWWDGV